MAKRRRPTPKTTHDRQGLVVGSAGDAWTAPLMVSGIPAVAFKVGASNKLLKIKPGVSLASQGFTVTEPIRISPRPTSNLLPIPTIPVFRAVVTGGQIIYVSNQAGPDPAPGIEVTLRIEEFTNEILDAIMALINTRLGCRFAVEVEPGPGPDWRPDGVIPEDFYAG